MVMVEYPMRLRHYAACIVAVMLCLLGAPGASAQPPVLWDNRSAEVGHYDRAALRLRFRDWGTGYQNSRRVHVFLRLSQAETILTVAVPPGTSPADAEKWFLELIDALKWKPRSLHASDTPTGIYLRVVAPGLVQENGLYRRQVPLDLDKLREQLPRITPLPVNLAVRAAMGAEFITPGPAVQGISGQGYYGFYRLTNAPAGTRLRMRYGSTQRWMLALNTAAVIWFFLPMAALLAARRHLARRPGVTPEAPRERLQDYRRWQRGILLTGMLGGGTTLAILGFTRVVQVTFRVHPSAILFLFIVPFAWLLILGRLVGLPLEREAYPIRKNLPWYRAALGELIAAAALLVLPTVFVLLDRLQGTFTPLATPSWLSPRVATAGVVGLIGLLVAAIQAWSSKKWQRRKEGTSREALAPEAVVSAVRELTERLACPVERIYMLPKSAMFGQLAVQANDRAAIVAQELVEQMRPEQVAGLIASAALTLRVAPRDRRIDQVLIGLTMLPIGLLALMFAVPALTGIRFPGWMMPLLMLSAMSTSIFSIALARRTQKRNEDADLAVADACEAPRLYLNTLRDLEELQVASSGMDPAAAGKNPVLTRRRVRLQERLGLD